MSIKIQINSLEALERLLGNDDTMEIEVRKSVVDAFAKGFVKPVQNLEMFEQAKERIERQFQNEVQRQVSKGNSQWAKYDWLDGFTLTDKTRVAIQNEVKKQVNYEIEDIVSKSVQTALTQVLHEMEVTLGDQLQYQVKRHIKGVFDAIGKNMVSNALNELGYEPIKVNAND